MALLIANVGLRDVRWNVAGPGEPARFLGCAPREEVDELARYLGVDQPGARRIGEALLARLEKDPESPRLCIPMVAPALSKAHSLAPHDRVSHVELIATDNDPAAGGWHYWNDTIHTAEVIRTVVQRGGLTAAVRTLRVPDTHDGAYAEVRRTLLSAPAEWASAGLVFLEASGGVPAINSALVQLGLNRFDKRLRLLQPVEPAEAELRAGAVSEVRRVPLRAFRTDRFANQMQDLLGKAYDYHAALQMFEREREADPEDRIDVPLAEAVLRYALTRFNLDYEGALGALTTAVDGQATEWRRSVADADTRQLLMDAFETARICFQQRRWMDFVWRIASIEENTWRWWAEHLHPEMRSCYVDRDTGDPIGSGGAAVRLSFHVDPSGLPPAVVKKVEADPHIKRWNRRGKQEWQPDRHLFHTLTQVFGRTLAPGAHDQLVAAGARLRKLEPITHLRNDSVHLLRGLSARDVARAWDQHFRGANEDKAVAQCADVLNAARAALEPVIGGTLPPSPFKAANEFVIGQLQRDGVE